MSAGTLPRTAFAHWLVLLMGWVWLGEQGQRLGWSLAGGVLAVVLWWTLRVLVVQHMAGVFWPRSAPVVLGAATALGAWFVGQASHAGLLAVAVLWALWSALLEVRQPRSATAGAPVAAALLTWAAVFHPLPGLGPGASVALVLLIAALASTPTRLEPATAPTGDALPQTAMGLMMGSLWLSSAWCSSAGPGGAGANAIGLHLLMMTALPLLCRSGGLTANGHPLARQALVLTACVALWLGDAPLHGLTGMALLVLACAMPRQNGQGVWAMALLGPALLLAVGIWSPLLGPQALQRGYGLLACVALASLLHQGWRTWRGGLARPGRVSI